jgi:DNA-directed RNA polymerase subunit RPC12/RpoP
MEKKEYIERGAAVDELRRRTKMVGELIAMECDSDLLKKVLNIYYNAREEAAKVIEEVPAADVVEVVHAKWIDSKYGNVNCGHCGVRRRAPKSDDDDRFYCAHCGAKMDGGKE